ncbi:MAG: histone [Candidatus Micrarchaeales archaeon]
MLKDSLKKIIKKAGIKKISDSALEELSKALERNAKEIIEIAKERAKKEKRKTITAQDIRYAKALKEK